MSRAAGATAWPRPRDPSGTVEFYAVIFASIGASLGAALLGRTMGVVATPTTLLLRTLSLAGFSAVLAGAVTVYVGPVLDALTAHPWQVIAVLWLYSMAVGGAGDGGAARAFRRLRDVAVTGRDLDFLRRCVQLADEALRHGDEPFGSLLVDADGAVRFSDHSHVNGGDATRHPELAIAQWAAEHLDPPRRASSTVYTSGEHCPMCAAAHAWVGLGRVVYAASSAQLTQWLQEWGAPVPPVAPLPITVVAPGVPIDGPVPELTEQMRGLYEKAFRP